MLDDIKVFILFSKECGVIALVLLLMLNACAKDVIITDAIVALRGIGLFKVTKLSIEGTVNCTHNFPAQTNPFYFSKRNYKAANVTNQPK